MAHLGIGERTRGVKKFLRRVLDAYLAPVRREVARTNGKFREPADLGELAELASTVTSLGNQAGEGWLLTAEILHLIAEGVPNVVCAQPFACLPNHVTGNGMFGEIRRQHPEANIATLEFDPGASSVNQLNRLKLLIAAAQTGRTAAARTAAARTAAAETAAPDGSLATERVDA